MDLFRKPRLGRYYSSFNRVHKEPTSAFWKRFIKKVIALFCVFGIVYFLLFSNFFVVKKIDVLGQNLVHKDEILSFLPTNENIFLYPVSEKIVEIQNKFPEIAEMRILRGLPNSLNVVISEYQPMLVWERNGKLGLVNDQGIFFYSKSDIKPNIKTPRVVEMVQSDLKIGDKVATSTFVKFVQNFSVEMQSIPGLTFDHVELGAASFDALVKTKENIDIYVASDDDLIRQISYLRDILAKRRDKVTKKIDVRIPRWAYVE
ncbi:MAG: Cell division protein ftsQ [Berkelbacteria bacterium GW2011_GWA2_38_9]|uniref:Cell division protein ftsQ n=1 Tax=Berkelbacteria bacterium GW2011_GWA2_38_9 TaxID=1618334 RepID=A0A0G0LCV1_9BACT|nr:MAG: Cell division protein ftsQ [Berkelbacteria bacterium GW2011_GWA2_38_9]